MPVTYLILGSNMGDRNKNMETALKLLQQDAGIITRQSSLYETEPWGFESNTSFLNQVIQMKTQLGPEMLIKKVLEIEKQTGRTRNAKNSYESREIDIDILFYENIIIQTDSLVIPHPRMQQRMFVMVPLAELIPDFIHPVLHTSIRELKDACTDTSWVRKMN